MSIIQFTPEQIEFLRELALEGEMEGEIYQDYAGAKESANAVKDGFNFFAVYDNFIQSLQHEMGEFDLTDDEAKAEINKFFDYLKPQ